MVSSLYEADQAMTRKTKELIHKGRYAAEVAIELHYSDESRSPTMSADDARIIEL
jgi:hypothetical protein